jgi:hypothetical protein
LLWPGVNEILNDNYKKILEHLSNVKEKNVTHNHVESMVNEHDSNNIIHIWLFECKNKNLVDTHCNN